MSFNKSKSNFKRQEFKRLNGKCPICQVYMTFERNQPNTITFDHIVPKGAGGKDQISNGQIMCSSCNGLKKSLPDHIFKQSKLWLMSKLQRAILAHQYHGARTGDIKCIQAIATRCAICCEA